MPNIREVNAGTDIGLRTDDRAASSTANSGRRIAALYGTAAEANSDTGRRIANAITDAGGVVVKWAENREVSKGAADSARVLANLDQKWNDTVKGADPNDPTVAAKFREEVVEPTLQALKDGPITEGGQRFAEATVQRFRNHFFEKTSSDMARLAGVAARQNIETLTNSLSNAALSDPTSLKTSLGLIEHSVGSMVDSSPNLGGVDAARVKMELTFDAQKAIVKAAAVGAISANPEEGLKRFSGPEFSKYISGADLKALEQRAKEVQRADRVEQNYARVQQERAKEEASDAREGEYLKKIYSGDPKEAASVSARAIANDFTLSRVARERMISLVNRETKPETDARISQRTFVGLLREMRDPNADPETVMNKAWEARLKDPGQDGSLTERDFNQFRTEMVARKTPDGAALEKDRTLFFKQYAGAIAGRGYDPVIGSPKLYAAEMDARRVEAQLRAKGLDPHLAYDPSSEYFIGKPGMISKWSGSMQGDLADKAAGGPPKPAERVTPPSLRGIADLDYSPSRQQYRDRTTGKVYDKNGNEVGK